MKTPLLATVALLTALATPTLAFDLTEKGTLNTLTGTCYLTIAGVEDPYCLDQVRAWRSYDKQRYSFETSFKNSENAEAVTYTFVGSHAFYTPDGEPDIFMIQELWITSAVNGKDVMHREKASGKCAVFVDAEVLYLDCNLKGKKFPAIGFKFIATPRKEQKNEQKNKSDNKGGSNV